MVFILLFCSVSRVHTLLCKTSSHIRGMLVWSVLASHAQPGWLEPVQSGFGHQNAGRWAESVVAYRAAIASGLPAEHQLTVAINLGLALQNTGALNEALLIYDKVLSVLPTNADTHHNRGNALYQAARPSSHAAAEPIVTDVALSSQAQAWDAIVSDRAR
jgi:tetratricopeptide (TPR) repeat protein